jgi:hypothetical protein
MATEKMSAWTKVKDGAPILKAEMLNKLYKMLSDGWTASVMIEDDGLLIEYERTVPDPEPTLSSRIVAVADKFDADEPYEDFEVRNELDEIALDVEALEARITELESERDEWKRKYENHPNVCAICYHHFDEDTPPADTGKQMEPTLAERMRHYASMQEDFKANGYLEWADEVEALEADNARLRSALRAVRSLNYISSSTDEINEDDEIMLQWRKFIDVDVHPLPLADGIYKIAAAALDGRGPDAIPRTATITEWWHKVDETTVIIEGNLRILAINLWNEMIKHSHSVSSNEVLEFAEQLNNLIYRIDREVGVEMAEETDNLIAKEALR